MKKQFGNAIIGTFALIVIAVLFATVAFSFNNKAVRMEKGLEATWVNNQNILGQYTLKVQEIAQVPEMYKNDLKEVMSSALSSRYGSDGSKANMQWIKEHAINFDSSMYTKIQQVMEAGRNEFQVAQTRLIDEKRAYVTSLETLPGKWIYGMMGFPSVNLDKYKPVLAADTSKVFETGVQAPVKLR